MTRHRVFIQLFLPHLFSVPPPCWLFSLSTCPHSWFLSFLSLVRPSSPAHCPRHSCCACAAAAAQLPHSHIPLSLSLFPLLLATPLPLTRRFRSGSVTWPRTPSRETNPLELTHAGPTLVRPSMLSRK